MKKPGEQKHRAAGVAIVLLARSSDEAVTNDDACSTLQLTKGATQ
ncbi:MAG: hypothetical protein V4628_01835 [Pseudomonadota bacterium]